MRVLLIHQTFASPDEPGGTRHYELARRCAARGIGFTVVASTVTYATGKRAPPPTGAQDGELRGEVRIVRASTPAVPHWGFTWRVFAYLVFMVTSMLKALRSGRPDITMGTSPPIFQAGSAWFVAALRGTPFLLEIRDLWPEFAVDIGVLRNRLAIWLARAFERFLYRRATHIVVNSPAYRAYLIDKGVPPGKISFVPNGTDTSLFDPDDRAEDLRKELGIEGRFVVTYAGAIGLANDIGTILRAAERLEGCPEIQVLLVGDGNERPAMESLARELGLGNVTFAGSRPKSEIPRVLAASDVCVATLKDIPTFRTTYPNKVFDYMAAARPTVLAIDGVIRSAVEDAGGGVFVPPGDPDALASAIKGLYRSPDRRRRMGASAREYVVAHFDRDMQAEQFMKLLRRLAR